MQKLPFNKPGAFLRGNLHTHSTCSDGQRSASQVCDFYRANGYDFLAITDHFLERYGFPVTDTSPYRTQDFTTLFGAELHAGETELGHLWHILAVGLPLDFAPLGRRESGPEIAKRALDSGAFVAAAHPAWYGITEADVLSLGAIQAIEIYNGTSCDHNDRPESWYMADLMAMRGKRYSSCATDDAHFFVDRSDAMRGWVYVKSESMDPADLLSALKAGHYYSSTGPQIHDVRLLRDGHLHVSCSPAERIFASGYGYSVSTKSGTGLTHADLDLSALGNSPFVRVTVRDSLGGRAWTNHIWLK